jgi:hypothetical protein
MARQANFVQGQLSDRKSLRVYLFLRFEVPDERSEMRRDRGHEGVVLVLQALPDC